MQSLATKLRLNFYNALFTLTLGNIIGQVSQEKIKSIFSTTLFDCCFHGRSNRGRGGGGTMVMKGKILLK